MLQINLDLFRDIGHFSPPDEFESNSEGRELRLVRAQLIYRGRKGRREWKKRVAFRRENEALLSITTRRVGRTAKTRFIPDSSNATDRCHVIATLQKRLRGKPASRLETTLDSAFSIQPHIVIKLPSIRTNVGMSAFDTKKSSRARQRKSTFVICLGFLKEL